MKKSKTWLQDAIDNRRDANWLQQEMMMSQHLLITLKVHKIESNMSLHTPVFENILDSDQHRTQHWYAASTERTLCNLPVDDMLFLEPEDVVWKDVMPCWACFSIPPEQYEKIKPGEFRKWLEENS